MPVRVAVLLSTYNGEAFLADQLASLRAQVDVDVDLYVRDDGSRDRTFEILSEQQREHGLIQSVSRGTNLGPARSYLTLLQHIAPGGYDAYAFCDQDDIWLPEKLSRACARLARLDSRAPALYCSQVACVDVDLRPLPAARRDGDARFEHLLFENIAYGCTSVMNPAAFALFADQSDLPTVAMHDWWCALVVAAFGEVIYDDTPRILYRQHGNNSVGAYGERWREVVRHMRTFWRAPSALYPIHVQAHSLLERYGDRLAPQRRSLVSELVESKGSPVSRALYALQAPVQRSRRVDELAARALIAAGWY